MVIDFGYVLKNLDGVGLIDHDSDGNVVPLTLGRVAANALISPVEKENGADKVRKYGLALKVYNNKDVELTPDEVVTVKDTILKVYAPMICGQAAALLK